MSFIRTHLENAKEHVSEAEHEVKIVMSEILKRKINDIANIGSLRDAKRMLEDVYKILDRVQHNIGTISYDTEVEEGR